MRRVGTADLLVLLGVVLIGAAMWMMVSWPGVVAWCGLLLLAAGVAEARRVKA